MPIISANPVLENRRGPGRPSGGGGITSWATAKDIPGFNAGIWKPKRRASTQQFHRLMGFAIIAGRRGLPGLGQAGQVQGPACDNPKNWTGTPGPGCTPVGGGNCATELYGNIPCWDVRECDSYTGCVHFEYIEPGNTPSNVDVTEVDPNTGKVVGYSNAGMTVSAASPIPVGTQLVNPSTGAVVYTPKLTPAATPIQTGGGTSTKTPTAPAPPSGSGGSSLQVTLQNSSRPGQPFQVGDNFLLTIVGAPNAAVSVSASQNGVSLGSTSYGSTDGNGNFTLSGTMSPNTVGNWSETWSVGTSSSALSFSVANASGTGTTGAGGSTQTGGGGATSTDVSGSLNATVPPAATTSTTAGDFMSFLTAPDPFGFGVPNWLWISGAGLLFWFFFLRGKR